MSAAPWCLLSPFLSKPFFPLLSPPALGFGVGKLPELSVSSPRLPFAMPPRYNDAVNQEAVASVVTSEDERYGKKQVISLTPQLYDYILENVREPRVLRELREETAAMPGCQMLVSPEQAQLLTMLVQIMGAKNCIEIGVYTGYSSLAVALALPNSGHLVACERDLKRLEIAKKYYNRACVSHKVEIKHGLAYDTLVDLIERGKSCSFDFAFVDADKKKYGEYYELLLQLVRPGGLIIFDNVLWHGKVSDPQVKDLKTISLRNFNKRILEDMRVSISMVPIGDGMTICRKREADHCP